MCGAFTVVKVFKSLTVSSVAILYRCLLQMTSRMLRPSVYTASMLLPASMVSTDFVPGLFWRFPSRVTRKFRIRDASPIFSLVSPSGFSFRPSHF